MCRRVNKYYAILLASLSVMAEEQGSGVKNNEHKNDQQKNLERILVLYDNPMEEYSVLGLIEVSGYNIKNEKQRNAAIRALKIRAGSLKAHAIILQNPTQSRGEQAGVNKDNYVSAKAIRYKHFYY